MQHRMKTHPLKNDQIEELLFKALTGSFATLNLDGSPYVIPVHFIYDSNAVYIHGLPKGQKIENIKTDSRVSMTIYEMEGLILDPDEQPCDTNTKYKSVIVSGNAVLIDNIDEKIKALSGIVKKYTPQLARIDLPDNMVKGTAVIKVDIKNITGKYY